MRSAKPKEGKYFGAKYQVAHNRVIADGKNCNLLTNINFSANRESTVNMARLEIKCVEIIAQFKFLIQ